LFTIIIRLHNIQTAIHIYQKNHFYIVESKISKGDLMILTTVKITENGRISLNRHVLDALNAKVGDHVAVYRDKLGRICIAKVTPPEEA